MDYESFELKFFKQLKDSKKECISLVEKNKKLVEANLENLETVDKFVTSLNTIIIETEKLKYSIIEKLFNLSFLKRVEDTFKESDVLIQACKVNNVKAIKWLMSMNINLRKQDKDGMTALMYSVKKSSQLFVVKEYISQYKDSLNLKDNNGETALFHAVYNIEAFKCLVNTPTVDVNYKDYNDQDTILIRCIKLSRFSCIDILFERSDIDVNSVDKRGWPISFYFAEQGFANEFELLSKKNCNYNYVNNIVPSYDEAIKSTSDSKGNQPRAKKENILTIIMNKLYKSDGYEKIISKLENYYRMLIYLMKIGYDFNTIVDEAGNTAVMESLIANDVFTALYIIYNDQGEGGKYKLDLSIKNKYGDSVVSLLLKKKFGQPLFEIVKKNPSFSLEYEDIYHNDLLMLFAMTGQYREMKNYLKNNGMIVDLVKKYKGDKLVNKNDDNYVVIDKKVDEEQDIIVEQRVKVNEDNNPPSYDEIKTDMIRNHVNDHGENALILATKCRCRNCVKVLLENGVNDVNHQDHLGNTALHYAIFIKDREIIEMLLSSGADKNIKNKDGLDALSYAEKIKNDLSVNGKSYSYIGAKIDEVIRLLTQGNVSLKDKVAEIEYNRYIREDLIEIYKEVEPYLRLDYDDTFVIINGFSYFGMVLKIYQKAFGKIESQYYSYPYCLGWPDTIDSNYFIHGESYDIDICLPLEIDCGLKVEWTTDTLLKTICKRRRIIDCRIPNILLTSTIS
ncbi:hypothetical protein PIROE2DRAFT_61763 [Piromyces sp. E2]|nr:hypothetical protein PIROE2DRAFT_61763 [Piromyces sp. E2]|eukprot:OUM62609.1 hypothetical protein PIROE2DRAFT_61763 [Piromyces sp. E2]